MKTFKFLKFSAAALIGVGLMLSSATIQQKEHEKIMDATSVLRDFGKIKETIPHELMTDVHGIIIIPKLINVGLGIGGKRGKGLAMVKGPDGKWSNPVFVTLTGGSIGFQAGVQSVDLVLVFRHSASLHKIGDGTVTLGGDISVAAGPAGRSSTANTDYKLSAEAYSYSRSRGLFAGISVNGASLSVDDKENTAYYGQQYTAKQLFAGSSKAKGEGIMELKETLMGM